MAPPLRARARPRARRPATARRGALQVLAALAALAVCGALAAPATAALARPPAGGAGDGGVEVGEEAPATGNDLRAPRAHNSPQLAVDPTDDDVVVLANRLDAPDFSCALQVSGDGGGHWAPLEPVPELPEGGEKCYAPEVAFDADGRLYYLFVALAGRGNRPVGVYLTTSQDRGATFSAPRRLLGEGNYQVRMAFDRAAGPRGRLHLVWLQASGDPTLGGLPAPPNPIVAAYSDDGGQSLTEPVAVSDPDEHLRAVAPAVALGADGALHVAYYDLQDDARDYQGLEGGVWPGNWSVVHSVSHDGGDSFEPPVVVDDELQPPERVMLIFTMPPPALAADDAGNVYTAWHDARNGDWDVLAAASHDHGATWGRAVRVNDDERGNGAHQLLPQMAVAPDGRVEAVFFDRRHDDDNVAQDVYYAASTTRGASFAANARLSRYPSNSRTGARYAVPTARGKVELGLRLGLVAGGTTALAAWPDTRHALPGTTEQDVFTTTVLRKATAGVPATTWGLAVAGGLVLLAMVVMLRRRRGRPGRCVAGSTGVALLAAGLLLVSSCTPGRQTTSQVPAVPQVLEVAMRDDSYAFRQRTLHPGRVVFRAHNHGDTGHDLALVELPADAAGVQEWLDSGVGGVQPVYTMAERPPGEQGVFAVDLAPGHYGMLCLVTDDDGISHYRAGMVADFRVHPADAPTGQSGLSTPSWEVG